MLSSAYWRAVISPSLCLMAPKVAMATPNCLRVAAYLAASPMVRLAPPEHIAPSLKRPKFRTLKATLWPLPMSPSTASAGAFTSCRMTGVVEEPCRPSLCSSLPLDTPGHLRSTMKAVKCSPSTFAKTTKTSAKPPLVIHIFSPEITKLPSGCFMARVLAASASEPEPDSLRQYDADQLARDEAGQVLLLLRLGAEHVDRQDGEVGLGAERGGKRAVLGDLLGDDQRRDLVEVDAAVGFGDVGAEQGRGRRIS